MKVLKNKKVRNVAIVLLALGLAGGSYAYANTQHGSDEFGNGPKMAQGAPPDGQGGPGGQGGQGLGEPLLMAKVALVAVVQISTTVVLLKLLPKTPKVARPMRVPKGIRVLY